MSGRPAGARSIDEILAAARRRLDRVTPDQAFAELEAGAALIDIRPAWQRAAHGELTVRVSEVLPLERYREGYERLAAGGLRGKVVLTP